MNFALGEIDIDTAHRSLALFKAMRGNPMTIAAGSGLSLLLNLYHHVQESMDH